VRELGLKTPDELAVQLAIARAALAAGEASEARRALVHAGRLAGLQPQALATVARLQAAAGDAAGAGYTLGKALKIQPDQPELQALMAEAELAQAAPERAEARARALVQQRPDDARGHGLLGQIAQARGQWPQALAHWQRAHQLAPGSQSLLQLHAARAQVVGLAAAMDGLTQWLKSHPDDLLVRNALAEAQVAQRQWAAARSTYTALLAQVPGAQGVRNNLAQVLLQLGDPGAQALAEQALAADPGNGELIDTAGWAAFKSGQTDVALGRLRDARVRLPASPAVRYHLAAVLAQSGRADDARSELMAALSTTRPFDERAAAEALLRGLPAAR
jgi:predicted Zn-dependent protease